MESDIKFEPDLSACNAQAGAESGQISADFEMERFEIDSNYLSMMSRTLPKYYQMIIFR